MCLHLQLRASQLWSIALLATIAAYLRMVKQVLAKRTPCRDPSQNQSRCVAPYLPDHTSKFEDFKDASATCFQCSSRQTDFTVIVSIDERHASQRKHKLVLFCKAQRLCVLKQCQAQDLHKDAEHLSAAYCYAVCD